MVQFFMDQTLFASLFLSVYTYRIHFQEPIKTEKTEKLAKSIGATAFVETSAKTKENLQLLFETATREASIGKKQRNQNLKINCLDCVIL